MDFVKQKEMSRDEILAFFQTPKSLLGMVQDSNRANTQAAREIFAISKIDPVMQWFVDYLNEFFLKIVAPNEDLFFTYSSPVPEDAEFLLERNKFDVANGVKTPNEIRASRGLEPYVGGDKFFIPVGFVESGELATASKALVKKSNYIPSSKHVLGDVMFNQNLAKKQLI